MSVCFMSISSVHRSTYQAEHHVTVEGQRLSEGCCLLVMFDLAC